MSVIFITGEEEISNAHCHQPSRRHGKNFSLLANDSDTGHLAFHRAEKNPKVMEFPKREPFNPKVRKSREQSLMEQNVPEEN